VQEYRRQLLNSRNGLNTNLGYDYVLDKTGIRFSTLFERATVHGSMANGKLMIPDEIIISKVKERAIHIKNDGRFF